jgi:hypothetical protein
VSGGLLAKRRRKICVRMVRTRTQTPFRWEGSHIRFTFCETHLGKRQKSNYKQRSKRFTSLGIRFTHLSTAFSRQLADLRFMYRETIT